MKKETFEFVGCNKTKLAAVIWLPEGECKKILQITHGMTEHINRYTALAEELTAQGIIVAGFDLRGHGHNAGDPQIASFGKDGWQSAIEDMHLFYEEMCLRYPGLPYYMLGFSLGSFLLREYLSRYSEGVTGAVIMGTGYQPGPVISVMKSIVKGQIKKGGFDGTTSLVRQLSFGTYNQKFKPNRTESDWLCSDEKHLDAYLEDPLCRKDISAGLFWQLLDSMKRTGSKEAYTGWKRTMPVLLLSGMEDPVGNAGKGVQTVKEKMRQAGLENITLHLLPGARHDVLHEEASDSAAKVRTIISDWMALEAVE